MVKNLPASAIWMTQVPSKDGEDPLEKGKAYPLQCSYLENSIVRGAASYSPWSCKDTDMNN